MCEGSCNWIAPNILSWKGAFYSFVDDDYKKKCSKNIKIVVLCVSLFCWFRCWKKILIKFLILINLHLIWLQLQAEFKIDKWSFVSVFFLKKFVKMFPISENYKAIIFYEIYLNLLINLIKKIYFSFFFIYILFTFRTWSEVEEKKVSFSST